MKKTLQNFITTTTIAVFSFGCLLTAVDAQSAKCQVRDQDISTVYSGGCKGGLAHGKGLAKGRDVFEGEFVEGEKLKGKYTWANGETYDGEFKNDTMDGKGKYTWPTGETYDGEYKNGKKDGQGAMRAADGRLSGEGQWINGKFQVTRAGSDKRGGNYWTFVDNNGLEWMRCPLRADGKQSCDDSSSLTYFDAVATVTKLGNGWRLPDVDDWRLGLGPQILANANKNCETAIFTGVPNFFVSGKPRIWGARLYNSNDGHIYRTGEILADVIAVVQIPGCTFAGGYYSVYGFNPEFVTSSFPAYAVRDLRGKSSETWTATSRRVLNQRADLDRLNQTEREKEAERIDDDRRHLGEMLNSLKGSATANPNAIAGGARFSCSNVCRGSLFATGGRHTLTSFGANADDAREAAKDQAAKVCNAEGRSKSGAWWADMALCNAK